jgi:hypothetical protein
LHCNSDFLRTEYPQPTKRQESSLLSTSAKNEKAYPQTTYDSSLSNRAAEYLRICPCTGFPPETASFVCFVLFVVIARQTCIAKSRQVSWRLMGFSKNNIANNLTGPLIGNTLPHWQRINT